MASGRVKVVYEYVEEEKKIQRAGDKLKPFRFQVFGDNNEKKKAIEQKKKYHLKKEQCDEYHRSKLSRRTFDNERYICPDNNKVMKHVTNLFQLPLHRAV